MATTPNFNWSTPDNTGLVKNGALDIRTLGDSIDASMADLKGGTTGQVLSKTSNTDMDFTWVAQDDSNAIQNAIVDAKGDIIAATAADTPARLAVGTNGQVLTADSTAATGLKWASTSSAFAGVALTKSVAQAIPATTYTAITFDTEDFDTDGFHSTSSNTSRITIPSGKAGYYLVTVNTSSTSGSQAFVHTINKNGSIWKQSFFGLGTAGGYAASTLVVVMNLAVADYIESSVYATGGINLESNAQGPRNTFFSAYYLGA